jgi:hypothetical protein
MESFLKLFSQSTVDSPTLSIKLSSTTLNELFVIQEASLLPYLAPIPADSSGEGALLNLETISDTFNHYFQGQRQYLTGDSNNDFSSQSNNVIKASYSAKIHHALLVDSHEHERERARPRSSPSPDARNSSSVHPRHHPNLQHHPRPVFALSHRLLAFASPAPSYSYTHAHTSTSSPSTSPLATVPSSAGAGPLGLGLPTTQAEIGHAALKVGGSVLSGMRTIGGMALSATKSRVVSAGSGSSSSHAVGEMSAGGVAMFFSRSTPSEGVVGEREEEPRRERRYSRACGRSGSGGRVLVDCR